MKKREIKSQSKIDNFEMPQLLEKAVMVPCHENNKVEYTVKSMEDGFEKVLKAFKRNSGGEVDISVDDLKIEK